MAHPGRLVARALNWFWGYRPLRNSRPARPSPDQDYLDHLDDLIDQWHDETVVTLDGEHQPLHEYLGMTHEQYVRFVTQENPCPPPDTPHPAPTPNAGPAGTTP